MYRIHALQKVIEKISSEFQGELPDSALNIFLTVALEAGVTPHDLEGKLELSQSEIYSSIKILMALFKPSFEGRGLIAIKQGGALQLSSNGEQYVSDLKWLKL